MRHVDGDEISQSAAIRSGIRTQAMKGLFRGFCARGAGRRSLTLARPQNRNSRAASDDGGGVSGTGLCAGGAAGRGGGAEICGGAEIL